MDKSTKLALAVSGALVLTGIAATFLFNSGQRLPEIQVTSTFFNRNLQVRNVGREPIKILNVVLNDRDNCSVAELPGFNFSNDQLRQAFVFGYEVVRPGNIRILTERVIRVGESAIFPLSCPGQIVRATITTDQGSAAYTFGNPR